MTQAVSEVADGILRVGTHTVGSYLVEEGGRFTLVDAGFSRHWPHLEAALASRGATLRDVEAILVTHGHVDHIGMAERARRASGAPVRMHALDVPMVRRRVPQMPPLPRLIAGVRNAFAVKYLASCAAEGGLTQTPIAEVSAFEDGEVLDVPGRPQVLHAPGHTAGHCAISFPARNVLCAGDALGTMNVATGERGPVLAPPAFNADHAAALRSLDLLEATGAEIVLPGHGNPWYGGIAEAVRAARAAS